MKNFENILVTKNYREHAHIALIQLNRPKVLNALSTDLMKDVVEAMFLLEDDKDVRVIILTGNDRAFAAGDQLTITVNHRRNLLALVRMDDQNDLVMSHSSSPFGLLGPPAMRARCGKEGISFHTPAQQAPHGRPELYRNAPQNQGLVSAISGAISPKNT